MHASLPLLLLLILQLRSELHTLAAARNQAEAELRSVYQQVSVGQALLLLLNVPALTLFLGAAVSPGAVGGGRASLGRRAQAANGADGGSLRFSNSDGVGRADLAASSLGRLVEAWYRG